LNINFGGKAKKVAKELFKKQNKHLDKLIAYHEAGHAVMAFYKHITFWSVVMNSQPDKQGRLGFLDRYNKDTCSKCGYGFGIVDTYCGHCGKKQNINFTSQTMRRRIKREGLVTLAGNVAVEIYQKRAGLIYPSIVDIGNFFNHTFTCKESQLTNLIKKWYKWSMEAKQFLLQPTIWRQIESVATNLLEKRKLSYFEVEQLCVRKTKKRKYSHPRYRY
jgi:uncharacterized tellurite resistance protein B-like protein